MPKDKQKKKHYKSRPSDQNSLTAFGFRESTRPSREAAVAASTSSEPSSEVDHGQSKKSDGDRQTTQKISKKQLEISSCDQYHLTVEK